MEERGFLLGAEVPGLVQVAVGRDFEAGRLDCQHGIGMAFGVVTGHEERAWHALPGQHIDVPRNAAARRVAAPGVRAGRGDAAADFMAWAVEVHAERDRAAEFLGQFGSR